MIKSAADAVSLMTKMQGSPRPTARRADDGGLPRILVIGKAALAADLMTRLIFKHLEQNLVPASILEGDMEPPQTLAVLLSV